MKDLSIKLDNIKVAIFDFDDTLAFHKDRDFLKHRSENEETYLNFYLNAYLNPETFYESIESCDKSDSLYKLINFLRNNGSKLYCLSGMRFSFHLKAKQNFINKYYGNDIEVISCYPQERKIDAVKIIQKINNCDLSEILFVDDIKDNVDKLNNLGVSAFLIDEVDSSLAIKNDLCKKNEA
ncbi:MAG: hypothetical protein IJE05_04450 [Clostridia bacterium]|nr:hypothetical protein [Clostridia bacterium]